MSGQDKAALPAWLGWARLAIGLAQGLGLYALMEWREPQMDPFMAAAWVTLWFIPILIVGGLGALRWLTLAAWALAATALAAGLAWYDVARLPEGEHDYWYGPRVMYLIVPLLLFVGHHLVAAGDEARRWIAPYERYFDLGWRHGAQLVLALLFTGAFWAVLMLGAAMFDLIGIDFLSELVSKTWFSYPATCTVFALAIHLTDLRSGLVRGARALGLVLLSWLLPAMTGLAAAFFVALPFTGLEPLWATRAATALLLSAAATMVVLVNAAYQDGEQSPNIVLRWSARLASLLKTPLAVLAAYALYLRIDQYGLTPDRIFALAVLAVGACYALAYAIGAFWPRWMKPLEIGNVASAVVVMAVTVALFTPIADPARLSVDDQMRRLASGRVAPEQFDVTFLRFDGARYGRAALERLRADQSSEERRALGERAAAAIELRNRWEGRRLVEHPQQPHFITMRPPGAELPAGFGANAVGMVEHMCREATAPCDGYLLDLDSDGENEVIVGRNSMFWVYAKSGETIWRQIGSLIIDAEGQEILQRGEGRVVPSLMGDLMLGDQRVVLRGDFADSAWAARVEVSEPEEAPDDAEAPSR